MAGKPTYHHLNDSQGQRVLWLLEELRLASANTANPFDYNLVLHKRIESGPRQRRSPPELFETHPLGKCPQIVTPSGRVLIESSTCTKYLLDTFDVTGSFQGDPSDDPRSVDSLREDMLCSFAGASMPIPLMVDLLFGLVVQQSPFFLRFLFRSVHQMVKKVYVEGETVAFFKFLNTELEGRQYFMAGSAPSRPDFMLSWPVDFALSLGAVDLKRPEYKNVRAWHERCKSRPAWKSSLEKGNGYSFKIDV